MTIGLTPGGSLLDGYTPPPGSGDELLDEAGQVRGAWSYLVRALDALGPAELAARRRHAERLLRNDGVTYNIHGDTTGHSTAWALDPLPLVVGSDEWAGIEAGVAQRAELLDLVLRDLYGRRTLINRGLVPPEVVFAHRGFLRPCDGTADGPAHQLVLYAADLGRDRHGDRWVLADRAQAPSGAGYALENRVVVSRVFPSVYRDAGVHRLAPFFRTLRSSLADRAPAGVEDPRVVILTPGRWNESYFEHAYLASSLGYALVEGADLTVRDGQVWLRALGGLERVDVILRRVDGWFCDPLELRPDSQLGVPGLLEAIRRGTVSVVNPIGTGVLENPGLLPFLDTACRRLLGEDLRLPSPPTWWCGDPTGRSHVLANLHRLAIKPIARRAGRTSRFGARLSVAELDDLRARIEAAPHLWVGQEPVDVSSTPTLTPDGLAAHHAVLRTYAVARDTGYQVMAGGLTRVAPDPEALVISGQAGGISKDTWVIASEPELQSGFWLHRGPGVEALDPAGTMPSRAAEHLFWMGRYAERAEQTIRLVRTIVDRRTDFAGRDDPAGDECIAVLLGALTHLTGTYPGFVPGSIGDDGASADRLAHPDEELRALLTDPTRTGSLAADLAALVAAADAVRDQLSPDTWLVVSNLRHELGLLRGFAPDEGATAALGGLLRSLLALAGLAAESMVRDPGWQFLDAGRRVERALRLLALLRASVVPVRSTAAESLMLESVLVAAESIITYRRRYRSQAQVETLLDLLLLDTTNPRSVAYQLARLSEDVEGMPRPERLRLDADQHLVLEATTHLRLADTAALSRGGGDAVRWQLDTFLADQARLLTEAADAVDTCHFAHLQAPMPVGRPELTDAGTERGADA